MAVLGSCLTRDIFNSKFNLNYKHFFECALTQHLSSVISLMSPSVNYEASKIDNLKPFDEWALNTDLNKEFLQNIVRIKPDVLLMDFFADVYFGVLQVKENVYITNNRWRLRHTSFYRELPEKTALNLNIDPNAYLELWKESIDRFFRYIKSRLPDMKIIVVHSMLADRYLSVSDKKLHKIGDHRKDNLNVDLANEYLKWMTQYVLDQYATICLDMTKKKYRSYDAHPWSIFYVHYTMDYYQDALNQLLALTNMKKEKIRAVVFGAGVSAEKFLSQIKKDEVSVEYFVDNNPSKQNTYFKGIKIIPPTMLPEIEYDCIVIASQHSPEIASQLLKLGVPYEKIVPFYFEHHSQKVKNEHRAILSQITATRE